MGIELGPFGDTTDVDGWRLMWKSQQFLPGPPLWLFHIPFNREIPPLQGGMRGRTSRKHWETALKILSRRKPPGNVTRLATAVEGPRNKSFAHVLSLHSLYVHVFTIRFSFFLHYAPSFVLLQGIGNNQSLSNSFAFSSAGLMTFSSSVACRSARLL